MDQSPLITQSPPGSSTHATPSSTADSKLRAKRVLSCVLCQQRKVKCDRNFPCANCKRSGAQCVSTVTPQPRRRRFAERELLDRLRQYEDLLRRNHVDFKPMHPTPDIARAQEADIHVRDDASSVAPAQEVVVDSTDKVEPAYECDPDYTQSYLHWLILMLFSVDFLHAIKRLVWSISCEASCEGL